MTHANQVLEYAAPELAKPTRLSLGQKLTRWRAKKGLHTRGKLETLIRQGYFPHIFNLDGMHPHAIRELFAQLEMRRVFAKHMLLRSGGYALKDYADNGTYWAYWGPVLEVSLKNPIAGQGSFDLGDSWSRQSLRFATRGTGPSFFHQGKLYGKLSDLARHYTFLPEEMRAEFTPEIQSREVTAWRNAFGEGTETEKIPLYADLYVRFPTNLLRFEARNEPLTAPELRKKLQLPQPEGYALT